MAEMKMNFNKLMNMAKKNGADAQKRTQESKEKGGFSKPQRQFGNKNRGYENNNSRRPENPHNNDHVKTFGGAFHNPYTFIPFPEKGPERTPFSSLTVDELPGAGKRYTGVLELTLKTKSPLLSMDAENKVEEGEHFKYKALTIGNDVIVPATSIRGSLRSLMTIISGGTLGFMDENMWLCQGRDVSMNLLGKNGAKKTRLAEVCEPGDGTHSGSILHGTTRMVSIGVLNELVQKFGKTLADQLKLKGQDDYSSLDSWRPRQGKPITYLFTDVETTRLSATYSDATPWKIKLSGKRIVHNLDKRLFPVNESLIRDLAQKQNVNLERGEIWADSVKEPTSLKSGSADRNHPRYFIKFNRKSRTLEWNTYGQEAMFLKSISEAEEIDKKMWGDFSGRNSHGVHPNLFRGDLVWLELDEERIVSIQWARWGRGGDSMKETLPGFLVPDSMNCDGKVDMVTDLFGMVPDRKNENGEAFAARIKCHNLVFQDAAKGNLDRDVKMAPMGQPHPGCNAFYRYDGKSLNGYKVYRNAKEGETPWLYSEQGLFDQQGSSIDMSQFENQRFVKTVDLLKAGSEGKLKISFRALSEKEMQLLLMACRVDWKLGGGKPFGLGCCEVVNKSAIDENGDALDLSQFHAIDNLQNRVDMYSKSQEPVENLRYPRAVDVTRDDSVQRSGLQWFNHHVNKSKDLKQVLPPITAEDQHLYGYDLERQGDDLVPFDPGDHKFEKHGENNSPNRDSRQGNRSGRNEGYHRSWGR